MHYRHLILGLCINFLAAKENPREKSLDPFSSITWWLTSNLERVLLHQANSPLPNVSHVCINATQQYLENVRLEQAWALKMFDATGRPDSGVLRGGLSFLGDYTGCTGAITEPIESHYQPAFVSSYCMTTLATAGLQPNSSSVHLPQIMWEKAIAAQVSRIGLCIPSLCSPDDITELWTMTLSDLIAGAKVLQTSCSHTRGKFASDKSATAMIGLVLFFIVLATFGTIYKVGFEWCNTTVIVGSTPEGSVDPLVKPSAANKTIIDKLFVSFSVIENSKKIFNTSSPAGDTIGALHGLRVWSMLWIIFGHSYSFAQQWLTYRNPDDTKAIPADIVSQGIANGTFSVDTFFFLSGLLVAYVTFTKMDKAGGRLNIIKFYLHRYWRMTPLMMVTIGVCACLLPYISSGPRWSDAISMYDSTCQKNWWVNLLYLQNFVNTPQMCLNHTWFSAVDMQFYLISPLLLLALYRNRWIGLVVIAVVGLASMATTALIIAVNNYPAMPYISNIVPADLTNKYMANVYIKPYCRIGPYLVGMLTGYALYLRCHERPQPQAEQQGQEQHEACAATSLLDNPRLVAAAWAAAVASMLVVLYAMWDANTGVALPSPAVSAIYGACSRTLWAVGLAWIVLACASGNGGLVNSVLSARIIVPISRLTYSAYIIHPIVMAVFYGSRQGVYDYSPSLLVYFALGNILITYALSFVASLLFESPLIAFEHILLR